MGFIALRTYVIFSTLQRCQMLMQSLRFARWHLVGFRHFYLDDYLMLLVAVRALLRLLIYEMAENVDVRSGIRFLWFCSM
jgi:hypothetical protein